MICPYNGFKEMDCAKCAAHEVTDTDTFVLNGDGQAEPVVKMGCRLVRYGAHVPTDVHVSYEGIHFHPNKIEQWRQLAEDDLK